MEAQKVCPDPTGKEGQNLRPPWYLALWSGPSRDASSFKTQFPLDVHKVVLDHTFPP